MGTAIRRHIGSQGMRDISVLLAGTERGENSTMLNSVGRVSRAIAIYNEVGSSRKIFAIYPSADQSHRFDLYPYFSADS